MTNKKLIGAFLTVCGALSAQGLQTQNNGAMPIYRVSVTSRTVKAVSYQHRSGSTKVDFNGTDLLPGSHGQAKVESKQGRISIQTDFDGMQPASKNGAEYLTYVLWAITPEGRTANLGEILLNGTKSHVDVTTDLQVFGLIVTAEPYYAVTRPSDLIVMENVVRTDTVGKIEEIDAKYELLQRGQYQRLSNPLALKVDNKIPIELYEGRNAVAIARSVGAETFATESFKKAEKSLAQAEAYEARNAGRKSVAMTAREAVQMAEDARTIAVKRQEEIALNTERQGTMDRATRAENGQAAAKSETDRVTRDAEIARIKAQSQADAASAEAGRVKGENDARMLRAANDADRLKQENEARTAAAKSEADRLKLDSDARMMKAANDADRLKQENEARTASAKSEADRLKLDSDTRMAAAGAEADRLKLQNDAERAASAASLDDAAKQKVRLETEKAELRIRLLNQFNAILQTRDTVRGLIVNMSDVLFDTGKYTLRPLAREKLAKVAGIVSGHPGLRLDVEGYTDSVGGDDYNQQLSEQRGGAVRDYLTQQGMSTSSVTAKGFGKNNPVAGNDTAQGRQQNRRVEIVISGDIIGTEIGRVVVIK